MHRTQIDRMTLAAVLILAVGCRSDDPAPSQNELDIVELRELLAANTLEPVTEVSDDPFAGLDPAAAAELAPEDAVPVEAGADPEADAASEPSTGAPDAAEPEPEPDVDDDFTEAINPYVEFGSRIIVYEDGRVTKPFPLRVGTGVRMEEFIKTYAPFKIWVPPKEGEPGVQTLDTVRIDLREKFDMELFQAMRTPVMEQGREVNLADWLIVTATPELLREVQHFIDVFAARPPQIEIEAKIVEVVTSDQLDVGITQIDENTPIFGFPDNVFVKSLGYNFPVSADNPTLLTLGTVQSGAAFNAIFEALSTYENVSISSHPKVAVREGAQASIVNTEEIPFFNITGINPAGSYGASLTYKEVGISLYVIPRIVGTDTVALNIDIEASNKTGTSVSFTLGVGPDSSEISNPILARRAAQTVVYLQPGQAVIIGGLVSERTAEQRSGIPVLKDIPLLGYLFGSRQTVKESANVLFFIRPRILSGTDLNRAF